MERGTVDPTPNLDELLQEEVSYPTVPVRGEGSFLVQQLPARRVQYAVDVVGDDWVPILPSTPKRARATLVADQPFYVSSTAMGSGMRVPANTPYIARHSGPIFARSASEAVTFGELSTVVVANPAPGANFSTVVPAGEVWEVRSVRYGLATSAAGTARTAELVIEDPQGAQVVTVSPSATHAVSTSRTYNWFVGGVMGGSGILSGPLPELRILPGWRIKSAVFGLDAGDQVSSIYIVRRSASLRASVSSAVELWAD